MKFLFRAALLTALLASTANGEEPVRGPYLQDLTSSGVLVAWQSDEPGLSQLRYRTSDGWRSILGKIPTTVHHLRLPFDKCADRCAYRVGAVGRRLSLPRRIRRSANGYSAFTALAFGDSGDGGTAQYTVAHALERERAALILHLGDLVYPRGADEHYDERFFDPYRVLLQRSAIYPVLGNHDDDNAATFVRNFHLPGGRSKSGTERYYSFSLGPLAAIALDSNLPLEPNAPQFEWLSDTLARIDRTKHRWIVVYLHHPLYSSGEHGSSLVIREAIEELLERGGVRLVLAGHDHNYERSEPGARFGGSGIVHIVSGGGGNSGLYDAKNSNAASRVFAAKHHYLKLSITPHTLRVSAITPEGKEIDRRILHSND
ncbi:MAG: hypothetical protein RL417_2376 [Pseudomonadota bacterium]